MFLTKKNLVLAVTAVAALGLGGCATYRDDFAKINTRLIRSTRRCRAQPRAPNRPTSPRSGPTSAWINSKAASSSSKPHRAASRAADRAYARADQGCALQTRWSLLTTGGFS